MNDIIKIEELPIEKLNFSVRTYNCLKRHGIETIRDLTKLNTTDLYRVRNLGLRCYEEILQKIHDLGLCFKDEIEETKEKRI